MMSFWNEKGFLSQKLRKLLLVPLIGTLVTAQATLAFASEGDGPEGAAYPKTVASKNKVIVTEQIKSTNGIVEEHDGTLDVVYGGGNVNNSETASGNEVIISGGKMTAVVGGISSSGNASNNHVTVAGGNITHGVVGGATFFSSESGNVAGDVTNNSVTIAGGTVAHVSGGEVGYAHPNSTGKGSDITQATGGNAIQNKVTVTGGTVTGGIVGGAALTGNATGNSIHIQGGKVSGEVIAGEVRFPTAGSSVTGNSITISGQPDLTGATLKGGVLGDTDSPAGNSLIIYTKNIQAKNISGFDSLKIDLPSDATSGDTVLSLSDTSGTDLSNMDIRVGKRWDGGVNDFANSTITLINNSNGGIRINDATTLGNFYDGVTLQYPVVGNGLSSDGNSYTASFGSPVVNPATQSTTASLLVPTMLVAGHGIHLPDPDPDRMDYEGTMTNGAEESSKAESRDQKPVAMDIAPFFDIGGGSMREKTGYGSYVDMDSVGMDAGVAFARDNRHGRLVFAPVVDYGNGDYDTYLSDGTRGKGTAKYWAGGIIARQMNTNGFYYEGSLRMGKADVDFISDGMRNEGDAPVSFQSSAKILTGHLRIGKVFRYGPNDTLHVYGLYTHTHQGGMDADLSSGEHYRFSKVDNGRLRIGARLTWMRKKNQRFYSGIAYQYTRNGSASAVCDGIAIPRSGQNGSSAMLEIGWQIRPNPNSPWFVDLNATGWIGMQKGVTAQIRIKKDF